MNRRGKSDGSVVWLKAGVLEDGKRTCSEMGTVQGGSISPLLAKIYLHYVFDLWVQRWRQKQARGDVVVVRFANDFVVGFEHRAEAERFLAELRERFTKSGLELHPNKTPPFEFGRFADRDRRRRGGGKPESFNLGKFTVLRQAKRKKVKTELRRRWHDSIPELGAYLRSVVAGHFQYYGVPMSGQSLGAFRHAVGWIWCRVLRRRGQRHRLNRVRMKRIIARWLPDPRICHPYPFVRLGVVTRGGSRRLAARTDLWRGCPARGIPTPTRLGSTPGGG